MYLPSRGDGASRGRSVIACLVLLGLCLRLQAAELRLDPDQAAYRAAPGMALAIDATGQATLDDMLREPERFSEIAASHPNFGFSDDIYWLRLDLINPSSDRQRRLLVMDYPLLDDVRLYRRIDNEWQISVAGDRHPLSKRVFAHRSAVFAIDLEPKSRQSLYLRVATESSVQLGSALYTPLGFADHLRQETLALGAWYGLMLVMLCYNLFLAISIRDRSYFLYCAYLAVFILCQMSLNGLASVFLWSEWVWWGNRATPFLIGASILAIIYFASSFLQTDRWAPRFDRFLKHYLVFGPLLLMVASLTAPYRLSILLAIVLMVPLCALAMIAGFWVWRRGYRPGLFFSCAWCGFLTGIAVVSLKNAGILPSFFLTDHAAQIGSALEVVLLSFGLADRINLINEEKHRFAARMEETNRRLAQEIDARIETESALAEARDRLEETVSERTSALERAVASLEKEVSDHELTESRLKIAQWEAESASRAKSELLVHISHEIRNPLNAIIGFSNLLERGADLGGSEPMREKFLENIRVSGMHLAEILDQVTDLSRSERAKHARLESVAPASEDEGGSAPSLPRFAGDQRVLVVEDNDINAEVLEAMLRNLGLDSERAVDGLDAVVQFRNSAFDLVLMDLHMPRMDGLEATRRIRAGNTEVPIVAISADTTDRQRTGADSVGIDQFLVKPVSFQQLLVMLEGYLRLAAPKSETLIDSKEE